MATESKRELILQNLKTTLEEIDGNDPYWTEVKEVKRVPFLPTEFEGEDKPGLMIVSSGEPESIDNKPGYHDRRNLNLGIVGILDRPSGDIGTAVTRFMKDIHIALMVDVTRGGNATETFIVRQLDASNLFGDYGLFEIELNIIYHCDARLE